MFFVSLFAALSIKTYTQCQIWKNSIVFWNEVIKTNDTIANAYLNRGTAYFTLGEYSLAMKDFNKAIEIFPDYVKAYNNLGSVYGKLGRYDLALKQYDRSLFINPNNPLTYYFRSIAHKDLHEYPKALDDALTAQALGVKVNPTYIKELQEAFNK